MPDEAPTKFDLIMNRLDALEAQVTRVGEDVALLLKGATPTNLGFSEEGADRTLFVKAVGESAWGFMNGDKAVPYPHTLKCLVNSVAWLPDTFKNKPVRKLLVNVTEENGALTIFVGLNSTFAKGLLLALDDIPKNGLTEPVAIEASLGSDGNVVLCRVVQHGQVLGKGKGPMKDVDEVALLERVSQKHFSRSAPQVPKRGAAAAQ